MFIYRHLTSCHKSTSVNRITYSTVGQTRLSSIAMINIDRSFANRILQILMDRIIDIFGQKKNL